MNDIKTLVLSLVSNQANMENLKPEYKLKEDLGLDSLDLVETVMDIEIELNIQIPDSRLESIKTIQNLIDLTNEINSK